jgi:hypothetical protein
MVKFTALTALTLVALASAAPSTERASLEILDLRTCGDVTGVVLGSFCLSRSIDNSGLLEGDCHPNLIWYCFGLGLPAVIKSGCPGTYCVHGDEVGGDQCID